jgi:hypothetical protein
MRRLSLLIGRKLGQGVLLDYSYADPGRVTESRRTRMLAHTAMPGWDLAWGELLTRSLYSPVAVSARLAQITQPVLLVSGDADKLVPVGDTRRVADQLPDASLKILEGCGHVPHEECPEAFWRAVSQWLIDRAGKGFDAGAARRAGRDGDDAAPRERRPRSGWSGCAPARPETAAAECPPSLLRLQVAGPAVSAPRRAVSPGRS